MKKIILFFIISVSLHAQNNAIKSGDSETVAAEASIVIPFEKLANKFHYAHAYGFWFTVGSDHNWTAKIGFNLLLLQNPRPINFIFKDSVYTIESNKFGLDFGIKAAQKYAISKTSKTCYLEFDTTLGIHYLDYEFPSNKKKKDQKGGFENTTFIVAPQIAFIYKNVGLKVQYRFTPLNVIEKIEPNFGSSSVAIGIVYKQ
jgi:hypothetical protein